MKSTYKLIALTLTISLFLLSNSNAQVVFNNDAVTNTSSFSPFQITISNFQAQAGNNRLLVVDVGTLNWIVETQVTSVTYNGQNLERANSVLNYNSAGAVSLSQVWTLTLGTGSLVIGDVVVTVNTSNAYLHVSAATYQHVNQTYPVGNSAGAVFTGRATNTITIKTNPNDAVIDNVLSGSGSLTSGANQTSTFNAANLNTLAGSFVLATGNSVDMNWSNLGNGGIHLATRLNHAPAVLPVQLSSFQAFPKEQSVQLEWKTASETNNDFFTIERSVNGVDFEAIGQVDGAGTSLVNLTYTYEDKELPNGQLQLYYRLKQTDFDGTFEYSEIVEVTNQESNHVVIKVYPNPATNDTVNISLGTAENAIILLHNNAGQQIRTYRPTNNVLQINMTNLPNGIYYATIIIDGKHIVKKLIKP